MTYKEVWNEMKTWLENGQEYLEGRHQDLSVRSDGWAVLEAKRIEGKLDGLKTCLNHMKESEKIYELEDTKLSLMDKWAREIEIEYRSRLRSMEGFQVGNPEYEMYKEEAKDILRLLNYIHSNYGIGYPFSSNLLKLIKETRFPYVRDKASEILDVWKGAII
jgi:hypothetical protein